MEKKTQREMYAELLAIADVASNQELVDFINGRVAQLDKKNKSNGELTETQKENIELGKQILEYMAGKENVTIAEIRKHFDLSSQKVTPIMSNLTDEGKVTKSIDKRVAVYTLVED